MIQTISAWMTPFIAALTIYIAYKQYNISKNKQKLELYDRRRIVCDNIIILIHKTYTDDLYYREYNQSEGKEYEKRVITINHDKFLFSFVMRKYIDEIVDKLWEYYAFFGCFRDSDIYIPDWNNKEEEEARKWIQDQEPILIKKMNKYLTIK